MWQDAFDGDPEVLGRVVTVPDEPGARELENALGSIPGVESAGIGLGVGWLLAPLISVALLGGDPRSPLVFGGVAGVFLAVGLSAALGPAIRAAALDPARVLRGD